MIRCNGCRSQASESVLLFEMVDGMLCAPCCVRQLGNYKHRVGELERQLRETTDRLKSANAMLTRAYYNLRDEAFDIEADIGLYLKGIGILAVLDD